MKHFFTFLFFILITSAAYSQFYNGLQNEFGKNRIQFQKFDWQFYRFDKFDVYFYTNGTELAKYVAESAVKNLDLVETSLDFTLEDRIEIIVYNKQSDFVQSNAGIGTSESNIGGTAKIVGSKMFVYFDEDHKNIDAQIKTGLAEILLNQWLYGGSWRDRVRSSTVLNLPDWYIKGLVNYLGQGWNPKIEDKTKDGILNGKFTKFNNLSNTDAITAGHSMWNYIAESYGKEVIPNLVYMSQISRNVESGFLFVFGVTLKDFINDWNNYYLIKYKLLEQKSEQNNYSKIKGIKRLKKQQLLSDMKVSPDGKFIAYSTNELGRYKVFIYDYARHKSKRIFKGGIKLERTNDYSFPLIAWHPSSQRMAFVTENKGEVILHYYLSETKEIESRPPLFYFEKILSIDYMPDGKSFLLSAVKNGQTDIFIYNIISNKINNITNDVYDDVNPCVIPKNNKIIFSSNRFNDSLKELLPYNRNFSNNKYDLYAYQLSSKQNNLINITNTPLLNETNSQFIGNEFFTYLSNNNGVTNRYIAQIDSGLAYVDTIEHYNYFLKGFKVSNYSRNIIGQNFSNYSNKYSDWFLLNGRIRFRVSDYSLDNYYSLNKNNQSLISTVTTNNNSSGIDNDKIGNLNQLKQIQIFKQNSNNNSSIKNPIDYNNYQFEDDKVVKQNSNSTVKLDIPKETKTDNEINKQTNVTDPLAQKFKLPKQLNYFRYFTVDQVVSQFNNNFSNNVYQKFTGNEVFFNPSLNGLFKIGLSDLFEDYRITGGFRLATDLKSNEFLLSYEDRHKRWDKQLSFYRQSLPTSGNINSPKVLTHTLSYSLKYPFSEVFSWRTSFSGRADRSSYLATDDRTLNKKNEFDYWANAKTELIFDNTIPKMINILYNTRAKIFGEYYNQINSLSKNLGVIGIDIRHYQKIHKNFIWASRFAASSSFGSQKLVYYLGAVDNWANISKNPTFNNSVPINNDSSYAFQTIATNMRGFNQNIRNGNNFAVLNNELRFPIFNYIFNRPIRSDFFTNLQIVTFYDIGSAWIGKNPINANEEYNTEVIPTPQNQISVTLVSSRQPIVYGYGWGLRSRLFGYFVRADWAWGNADGVRNPRIFYLSLTSDF